MKKYSEMLPSYVLMLILLSTPTWAAYKRKPLLVVNKDGKVIRNISRTIKYPFIALLPIYVRNTYSDYGLMMIKALRYAVRKVEKEMYMLGFGLELKNIIYGFNEIKQSKLGEIFFDEYLKNTAPVMVGPASSQNAYDGIDLFYSYTLINMVSFGATSAQLDNVNPTSGFVRTVPSDSYRVQVLVDVIVRLKWNYFFIFSSFYHNGAIDSKIFERRLSELNICVAEKLQLTLDDADIDEEFIKKRLHEDAQIQAVIFFTTPSDTRRVLKLLKSIKLERRLYFVFFYGTSLDKVITTGYEDMLTGSLSIDIVHEENIDFKNYFLNVKPKKAANGNEEEIKLWEHIFKCNVDASNLSGKNCSMKEKLEVGTGYYPDYPINPIIDAVYGVAYIYRKRVESFCLEYDQLPNGKKYCIRTNKYITYMHPFKPFLNATYSDGMLKPLVPWRKTHQPIHYKISNYVPYKGSFKNVVVGDWYINRSEDTTILPKEHLRKGKIHFVIDEKRIWWRSGLVGKTPKARCASDCKPGFIAVRDPSMPVECCWVCEACPPNHVTVNNTCVVCQKQQKVDLTTNKCNNMPQKHFEKNASIAFAVLTCLGLCSVLSTMIVTYRYRKHPMFTASGYMFWNFILQGIILLFLVPFAHLFSPNRLLCVLRVLLLGFGCILIYAPLVLKVYKISRTFFGAKTPLNLTSLGNSNFQLGVLACLVVLHSLVLLSSLSSKTPETETRITDSSYYSVHCTTDSTVTVFAAVGFSVITMVVCAILAFKVRHFPHNSNETKSIGVTMYLSTGIWVLFLAGYHDMSGKLFMAEYSTSCVSLIIGFVTLIGLYAKKVFLVLRRFPEDRTSPDGREGRTRGWSNTSKSTSNKGLSEIDRPSDLQSFLDHYCPPRERVLSFEEAETVFAGDRLESFSDF